MHKDNKIVQVSSSSRAALSEPSFIIECDGVIYLTLAVLAYDERNAKTDEQKEGCAAMRRLLMDTTGGKCLPCGEVCDGPRIMRFVQTEPNPLVLEA